MDKYLDTLSKMKNNIWCHNYLPQLEKIEQFVKGEITPQELLENADDTMKGIIYYTINKIINYEEKDVRYYIELPQDMFFNTMGAPCIIAGKVKDVGINDNDVQTIGPNHFAKGWPTFNDGSRIEIVGDFSQFPNGVMLYHSDWYRIISKYPRLLERMYYLTVNDIENGSQNRDISLEEIQQKINTSIQTFTNGPRNVDARIEWSGKEEAQYLPPKVIDSIRFIIPREYLTVDQVLNSQFGTFQEILSGQKTFENGDVKDSYRKL